MRALAVDLPLVCVCVLVYADYLAKKTLKLPTLWHTMAHQAQEDHLEKKLLPAHEFDIVGILVEGSSL